MRLLVATDIHGEADCVEKLLKWCIHNKERFDAVAMCGDFTQDGAVSVAEEELASLGKIAKVVAVPGNMDSEAVLQMLEEQGASIHKKRVGIGGFEFIGLGGAKPMNTYYRVNTGELEAQKYLGMLYAEGLKNVVLVSHSPPAGTRLEVSRSGARLGIHALRKIIEERQPLLCVCGHVHEAAGSERIGKTLCLNPGSLMEGNAAAVELPELKVRKINF